MRRVAWGRRLRVAVGMALLCAGVVQAQTKTSYVYDSLGRVVAAIDDNGPTVTYDYDKAGNRIRLSNGAAFQQYTAAFFASSTQGTTGLQSAGAMQDGAYSAASTIHITATEAQPWIEADLGAVKSVNHIKIAAADNAALGVGPANINSSEVEYSTDRTAWRSAATVTGLVAGAPSVVALGGVQARYVRLRRTGSGQLALGDFMVFSAASETLGKVVAQNDVATTTAGIAVAISPLANDYALEGAAPVISSFGQGAHGAVSQAGAVLTYTPQAHFAGEDTFTYAISNGSGDTDSATVAVTIGSAPGNNSPTMASDTIQVTTGVAATFDPRVNDNDPDGDILTIIGASTPGHGAVVINGGTSITYTPQAGFTGSDTFTYTVSDGRGATPAATVSLSVYDAVGMAVIDPANYLSRVTISGKTFQVSTADSNNNWVNVYLTKPMTTGKHYWEIRLLCGYLAAGVTNNTAVAKRSGGYVTSENTGVLTQTGRLWWPGWGGLTIAPYTVNDIIGFALDADAKTLRFYRNNVLQGTTTFAFAGPYYAHSSVKHYNVVLAGQTCGAAYQNKGEFLAGGGIVHAPPTGYTRLGANPNGAPVTGDDSITTPSGVAKTFGPLANDSDPDGDTLTIDAVGTPSHGTAVAVGGTSITYTPTANYGGPDSFSYTISDGRGGVDEGAVTVSVGAPAPVANAVSASVAYGSTNNALPLSITGTATSVAILSPPTKGAGSVSGIGIIYTPNAGQVGADSLTYTATNAAGTSAPATISITIAAPPAPLAGSTSLSVGYETPGSITLPVSGSYASLDLYESPAKGTVSISGANATYTPTVGQTGPDSFRYTATGLGGVSSPGTVSVTIGAPAAPTAGDTAFSVPYQTAGSVSLPVGGSYTSLSVTQTPTKGVVSISGASATYTPNAGQTGADSFRYAATGPGGTSAPALVTVSIGAAPSSSPPTAGNTSLSVAYNTPGQVTLPVGGTYTSVDVYQQGSKGSVSISGTTATYTPNSGQSGADTFRYTATGPGGTSAPATVNVSIGDPPLPPAPTVGSASLSVAHNTAGQVSLPVSGSYSSLSVSQQGSKGSASISGTTATYTPTTGQSGADTFYYTATGPGGTSAAGSVSVTIGSAPVNQPPNANDDWDGFDGSPPGTMDSWTVNVVSNDTDPENDTLVITGTSTPTNGAIANIQGGSILVTNIKIGTTTFSYTISDGHSHTDTANVTIVRNYVP